jgi:hypothetical protein
MGLARTAYHPLKDMLAVGTLLKFVINAKEAIVTQLPRKIAILRPTRYACATRAE